MADAVLFDLDGTFADTAPDLGSALNHLRADLDLPPVPLQTLRPFTSQGVRGMLGAGLGMHPEHPDYQTFHERFLLFYTDAICVHTVLFPGIAQLVDRLEANDRPWGIVTNKAQRFTQPLMEELGYASRAACIVSGDSAARPKPFPDPMQLACKLIARPPKTCLYVGDDLRDVQAGQSVGMRTIAVRYGYLGKDQPIETWGADYLVDHAGEIAAIAGLTC